MDDVDLAAWITDYVRRNQYPPSVGEVAAAIGRSRTTAHSRLRRMVDKGLIQLGPPGQARTIRVIGKADVETM